MKRKVTCILTGHSLADMQNRQVQWVIHCAILCRVLENLYSDMSEKKNSGKSHISSSFMHDFNRNYTYFLQFTHKSPIVHENYAQFQNLICEIMHV